MEQQITNQKEPKQEAQQQNGNNAVTVDQFNSFTNKLENLFGNLTNKLSNFFSRPTPTESNFDSEQNPIVRNNDNYNYYNAGPTSLSPEQIDELERQRLLQRRENTRIKNSFSNARYGAIEEETFRDTVELTVLDFWHTHKNNPALRNMPAHEFELLEQGKYDELGICIATKARNYEDCLNSVIPETVKRSYNFMEGFTPEYMYPVCRLHERDLIRNRII